MFKCSLVYLFFCSLINLFVLIVSRDLVSQRDGGVFDCADWFAVVLYVRCNFRVYASSGCQPGKPKKGAVFAWPRCSGWFFWITSSSFIFFIDDHNFNIERFFLVLKESFACVMDLEASVDQVSQKTHFYEASLSRAEVSAFTSVRSVTFCFQSSFW